VQGDFVWPDHKDTDEVFIVIDGKMIIEFRDGVVELSASEMFVVPEGIVHKPFPKHECHVLLVEPRRVTNTGEAAGEKTADNDLWV
jgi:mannose-6-phosphate isomerase-like protein (cupin superfamily)